MKINKKICAICEALPKECKWCKENTTDENYPEGFYYPSKEIARHFNENGAICNMCYNDVHLGHGNDGNVTTDTCKHLFYEGLEYDFKLDQCHCNYKRNQKLIEY